MDELDRRYRRGVLHTVRDRKDYFRSGDNRSDSSPGRPRSVLVDFALVQGRRAFALVRDGQGSIVVVTCIAGGRREKMSTSVTADLELTVTDNAAAEVRKFMEAEGVTAEQGGGLRVSVQPGGCSGFKYSLVIEDKNAEDDFVLDNDGF